jgi:hypothetical protein
MSADRALMSRISACAEQDGIPDSQRWAVDNIAAISASPGWADSWASAVVTGNADPGQDHTVITDDAILTAIRARRPV